jgi:hypothetical protein
MGQASYGNYERKKTYGEGKENERVEEKESGRRKRRPKEEEDFKHARNNSYFFG